MFDKFSLMVKSDISIFTTWNPSLCHSY